MITTTLKKIREHSPGSEYDLISKSLNGYGENTPIKFSQIVEIRCLSDALWCLRSVCPEHEKEVMLLAADFAESVLPVFEKKHPKDDRARRFIDAARDQANGLISRDKLLKIRNEAANSYFEDGFDVFETGDVYALHCAAWCVLMSVNARHQIEKIDCMARAARRAAFDDLAEWRLQVKMLTERFS